MSNQTLEAARHRIALQRSLAPSPNDVVSACKWCGIAAEPGLPGLVETRTEYRSSRQPLPPLGDYFVQSDTGPPVLRRELVIYGWRECGTCAVATNGSPSISWAKFGVDLVAGRAESPRWSKAAGELGDELMASGDLIFYRDLADASHRDPGNARPWAHIDEPVVAKWKRRLAALTAEHAKPEPPCRVCGSTVADVYHPDDAEQSSRICGGCRLFRTVGVARIEDYAANAAAGLKSLEIRELGAMVDFVVAEDHPNFQTDEDRGPWEYLPENELAALRGLAERMVRERDEAEAERKAKAEAEIARAERKRLRIPT